MAKGRVMQPVFESDGGGIGVSNVGRANGAWEFSDWPTENEGKVDKDPAPSPSENGLNG
jgi:hypothetical protein